MTLSLMPCPNLNLNLGIPVVQLGRSASGLSAGLKHLKKRQGLYFILLRCEAYDFCKVAQVDVVLTPAAKLLKQKGYKIRCTKAVSFISRICRN
jgi:hypothetical protein